MKRKERITLEEAQRLVRSKGKPVESEWKSVIECSGKILAEDICAVRSHPPFARSAMDGYALQSADTIGASRERTITLKVVDKICAGDRPKKKLHSGEAIRIMTGGMIPEGADCVLRQEDTDYGEEQVVICAEAEAGQCCCPEGEDFAAGDVLAGKGDKIDAYTIAAAVAAGKTELLVRRAVRVAVITTGSELRHMGDQLEPGQIYNSNLVYLQTRLIEMGCLVVAAYTVKDDKKVISDAILKSAKMADIVVTTGGVSVGEKDLLPDIMNELGAEMIFHGVDIKPGMPTMFSVLENTPVLSLSGNPYSAFAVFELLMPHLIGAIQQRSKIGLKEQVVAAGDAFLKRSVCRRIIRGRCEGQKVYFSEKQRNGQLTGGIGTNCLVKIEGGIEAVQVGDKVKIFLLED